MRKGQEWGGMYQRYKNISLNKIQRSNVRVLQDKDIMIAVSVKRRLGTVDCRPGVKCKLCVKCRLQTESKTQAGVKCRPSINCSRGRV